MNVEQLYLSWLENVKDEKLARLLREMKGDHAAVEDAFFKELSFGTGGLRGKLGVGTNRMNDLTVGRATLGFADYIVETAEKKSVVIAYDSRNMSREFAFLAADIMSSKGVKAYVFDRLMPTPVLSYSVRELNAGAGIVITASHNPKEYNGYKVYNEYGCQITDAAAEKILGHIEKYGYFNEFTPDRSLIEVLSEELLDKFIKAVTAYSLGENLGDLPKIVYTPLNGTGNVPVKKLFSALGVDNYVVVPEQEEPDGNFTTCPFPNPEEKAALDLAVSLAVRSGAGLVIATDPDADRVGIATVSDSGEVRLFNGNETGVLMLYHRLNELSARGKMPPKPYIVRTVVTTPLADKIAADFGVGVKKVLTGFKYIGEAIDRFKGENYVFGMEESYGYLIGTHARDKDSISAVMGIVEMYSYYDRQGLTLGEALEKIYGEYGYYESSLYYKVFEGKSGLEFMRNFMDGLRRSPWTDICGKPVLTVKDYLSGDDGLPPSNVLTFGCEDRAVIVRPSGTEPKIKFYLTAWGKTKAQTNETLVSIKAFVTEKL